MVLIRRAQRLRVTFLVDPPLSSFCLFLFFLLLGVCVLLPQHVLLFRTLMVVWCDCYIYIAGRKPVSRKTEEWQLDIFRILTLSCVDRRRPPLFRTSGPKPLEARGARPDLSRGRADSWERARDLTFHPVAVPFHIPSATISLAPPPSSTSDGRPPWPMPTPYSSRREGARRRANFNPVLGGGGGVEQLR